MATNTIKPKILIVDDDATLLKFMTEYLERENMTVYSANRGQKALRVFFDERPELVILDVMMPGMDGWEVCARIRELAKTPIILLTAKDSETDKLRGFRLGIDDYVTKPFSLAELSARVRAILARAAEKSINGQDLYAVAGLIVDMKKRVVELDGQAISLTPTEFRLLSALASRPGEAVSQRDLIHDVWGEYKEEGNSALRRYIWFLRKKIEVKPDDPHRIITLRGYGYRLEA